MNKVVLIIGLCPVALGLSAMAKTTNLVGTCLTGYTDFPTIGAAIAASPTGATILVCPGNYPEQVVITNPLTLKGVTTSVSSAAIVSTPSGGVQANTSGVISGFPRAPQVLVMNTSGVTISNLTVDGSNSQLSDCSTTFPGILFQNASGTISGNAIVNQNLGPNLDGCQDGLGVYVETGSGKSSIVTITKNYVGNYDKNGITGNDTGTSITVTNNTIAGVSATASSAQNGVQLGFGATGSVTGNAVSDDYYTQSSNDGYYATGILIYDAPNTPVGMNTISDTQNAVSVFGDAAGAADGVRITGNLIRATHTYDAIDICGANAATISGNTITGSAGSAIHLDAQSQLQCSPASTGNTVNKNRIDYACAGILEGPGSNAAIGMGANANIFANTVVNVLANSDVCPAAGMARAPRQTGARFAPVRP